LLKDGKLLRNSTKVGKLAIKDDWLSLSYRDLAGWLQRTRDPYAPIRAAYARTTDPMSSGRGLASLYSSHRFHIDLGPFS